MAQTIVGNGTLITFGAQCRLMPNGALLLADGLIAAMGDTAVLRAQHPQVPFLDARGGFIMPGMICAHTHTYGAFARGMALKDPPPEDFVQILERLWWRVDQALQPDDIRYSALVCLVDAIRHGTTTLFDHHASPNACSGSLDVIAQAFRQAGVRGSLCYEVSDRAGREKAHEGIRENERFARAVRGGDSPSPRPSPCEGEGGAHPASGARGPAPSAVEGGAPPVSGARGPAPSPVEGGAPPALGARGSAPSPVEGGAPPKLGARGPAPSPLRGEGRGEGRSNQGPPLLNAMMGLHAAFTLSDETIAEAVGVAHDLGVGCHIHVAEGDTDLGDSLERHHTWTVDRLDRLEVLGPQTIAAHCVAIGEYELQVLAETGTFVVHNPRSNMNNAVGTARVEEMLGKGVRVGLGNDGFSNDMFGEMKAAYLAHKAAQANPQAMPADVVQRLAIANNAHIAGVSFGSLEKPLRFGELAVGAPADVIVLDYKSPTPVTSANLPWHMIFGMDGGMVTTTIVNGRVLMRDRQLLTLDEDMIFARAREVAAALWTRF